VEELACACHLYSLRELSESELVDLLCNALETSLPTTLCLKGGQGQVQRQGTGQRNPGNVDVVFSTGFQMLHHSLWSNLANLLGPFRQEHRLVGGGQEVEVMFDQIGSETLRAEYGLLSKVPSASLSLDLLRKKSFDSLSFENDEKHQCHYVDLFQEHERLPGHGGATSSLTRDSPALDPVQTDPSLSAAGAPVPTPQIPPSLLKFRAERSWWAESGHLFCTSFLGEELSWFVMEFAAERMLLTALRRHSTLPETTAATLSFDEAILEMSKLRPRFFDPAAPLRDDSPRVIPLDLNSDESSEDDGDSDDSSDLSSHSSSESSDAWGGLESTLSTPRRGYDDSSSSGADELEPDDTQEAEGDPQEEETAAPHPEDLWSDFILWCQSKTPPSAFTVGSTSAPELDSFEIKKSLFDVSSATPLWRLMSRVQGLKFHSSGPNEKIVHFLLGERLLEMLTFQTLVHCHLTGTTTGLFVCRAVQIIVQQGEDNPIALRCLAYLTSMGVDVVEVVRSGNTLRGLGVDVTVPPPQLFASPNEQVLHSSAPTSSFYEPL
jgi:hypothetical protein